MNSDILKILIVVLGMPIWMPFVKALWREFNRAMREDGGLFGPSPSPLQRAEIVRELSREEDPLVNEPLAHVMSRQGGSAAASRSSSSPGAAPGRGAAGRTPARSAAKRAAARGLRR